MKFEGIWMYSMFGLAKLAQAAFVDFDKCLDVTKSATGQQLLQFDALNVTSSFNTTDPNHPLNITVYGNVTGQATAGTYPSANDSSWRDPNNTFGKIPDLADGASFYTTLFTTLSVLTYTPYNAQPARFCNATIHGDCPLAPSFHVRADNIQRLSAFSVVHNMSASFALTEILATLKIQSGYENGIYYSCTNVYLTPDIGDSLRDLLRYLPLGILVMVGVATIAAAMFSPWGTWDIFRWSSNFGRDEDVLRLVTPGFGDCLQYLQFIVLTGSLSLNYPGFYQPVVSRVGWSALLFNESFVSHGNGSQPIINGLYQYRPQTMSGFDRMTQLIGMTSPSDAWAAMMVWLVVIIISTAILTQIGFALRWIWRKLMNVPAEDLMSKNWYFTIGNVVRIAMGYFLLPLVALSMYQFVIANLGPIYSIALAAIVLVVIIVFAARLVFLFARTKPRSFLFDDLQTVLAYGPLYNTYCDNAATFALIPILVNILRGIAIGAVQASGVAQIVLLAISEVCYILTINAFRPYMRSTSMNLYHTCFSVIRILTILLSIAFVPSLNVGGSSRGWIGYLILLIHGCVLVFGFFLNAIQTLIEVVARLAGAGGSGGRNAARGGLVKVFGVRQLSKRMPRGDDGARQSMTSSAAILNQIGQEQKGLHLAQSRSRSISASSTMLLDNAVKSPHRTSQVMAASDGQLTPDASSTFSKQLHRHSGAMSPGGILGIPRQVEARDPYYRPPRRNTVDPALDTEKNGAYGLPESAKEVSFEDRGEGSSTPARGDDFDDPVNELTKTKTDYAVREVDFYYGVRGPALSSGTRRLKTGPADPTGPSATGWFRGLLGGRKKEKTKGFEVVRSARAPPPGLMPSPGMEHGDDEKEQPITSPYRDDVQGADEAMRGDADVESPTSERDAFIGNIPERPPSLPLIDSVGGIELPSRTGSEASKRWKRPKPEDIPLVPSIPRRSSKRTNSQDMSEMAPPLPAIPGSPQGSPRVRQDSLTAGGAGRMPFTSAQNSPMKSRHSAGGNSISSSNEHPTVDRGHGASLSTSTVDPAFVQSYTEHLRSNSSALGNHAMGDRPSSVGFVREHRASDGITHQHGAVSIQEGRSAEIHGMSHVSQTQSNDSSRRGSSVNPYGQPGQRSSRFRD